ncbi:MAG TPA: outer membrane beta-barrel protein [Bryobacteraceae bacterium]|nr:outer membrane beta-barrel protein [Bryobacteraceae bacterium]
MRILKVLSAISVFCVTPLFAQADYAELAGFGGFVSGIGTHGTVGGSLGYSTSRHIMPILEFSYIPLGSDEFAFGDRFSRTLVRRDSRAYEFNGGLHIRFPMSRWRAVPYGAFGLGFVRSSVEIDSASFLQQYSNRLSDTDFAASFGGGVRYPIAGGFGLRPEIKVFTTGSTWVRFSAGIYYEFR